MRSSILVGFLIGLLVLNPVVMSIMHGISFQEGLAMSVTNYLNFISIIVDFAKSAVTIVIDFAKFVIDSVMGLFTPEAAVVEVAK